MKDNLSQVKKKENLVIIFIATVLLLMGLSNTIAMKIIVILLGILFLVLLLMKGWKSKKDGWLHEYKVIKGLNWKDKVKIAKEEKKEKVK